MASIKRLKLNSSRQRSISEKIYLILTGNEPSSWTGSIVQEIHIVKMAIRHTDPVLLFLGSSPLPGVGLLWRDFGLYYWLYTDCKGMQGRPACFFHHSHTCNLIRPYFYHACTQVEILKVRDMHSGEYLDGRDTVRAQAEDSEFIEAHMGNLLQQCGPFEADYIIQCLQIWSFWSPGHSLIFFTFYMFI